MSETLNTDDYLYPIKQTEAYIDFRDHSDQEGLDRSSPEMRGERAQAITLGSLALAHAGMNEKGDLTPEAAMFNLIGHMDSFSHAQGVLDVRRDRLPREQRNAYKRDVIEFNHALKEAIALNPQTGMDGMLRTMSEAYADAYGSRNVQVFLGQARGALVGMQHELAAAQIIDATSGYEVAHERKTSVEDELNGIDIFVARLENGERVGETFGVDVKASVESVRRARPNSDHPDSIIASQCRNDEFDNSFVLRKDQARRKSHAMKYALDKAYAATRTMHYAAA